MNIVQRKKREQYIKAKKTCRTEITSEPRGLWEVRGRKW